LKNESVDQTNDQVQSQRLQGPIKTQGQVFTAEGVTESIFSYRDDLLKN